ncbi:MAG: endonuclease/exonuclease/phosphatase family protein [Catonella sp.]|uniref:endonuclease/exonuclease/phosphatase family protein n=1 Tax=Catonella sp. TaxID=2382125 RepID=UPI003F9FBC9F
MSRAAKICLKVFLSLIPVLGVGIAVLLAVLTVTEYKPGNVEKLLLTGQAVDEAEFSKEIKLISWNIGYCNLGATADFFMDGGKKVVSQTREELDNNIKNIVEKLSEFDADITFLQEADRKSYRSYNVNEEKIISDKFSERLSAFAVNFKSLFVPFPFPPLRNVEAGIMSLSRFKVESAERVSLPVPFKWPVSTCNLKRCLLVEKIPISGSDKKLVAINLHLEAYDSGEGKIAQTKALLDEMEKEYAAGNYVIAGGDFNQVFSNIDVSKFEVGSVGLWKPGKIDAEPFLEKFNLYMDGTVPTCRSLDRAYDKNDSKFQYYVIDGFIASKNIEVLSQRTIGLDFENSDHNPVEITIKLK